MKASPVVAEGLLAAIAEYSLTKSQLATDSLGHLRVTSRATVPLDTEGGGPQTT